MQSKSLEYSTLEPSSKSVPYNTSYWKRMLTLDQMEKPTTSPRILQVLVICMFSTLSGYRNFLSFLIQQWPLLCVSQSKGPSKAAVTSPSSYNQLKEKRAWEHAIAPAKSLPMQAFMLYMSGGGVQIFSMGIVFMLLLTPFKNIAGINDCSCPFSFLMSGFDVNLLQPSPLLRLQNLLPNP